MAAHINMKELLEAGVHFGHQTKRWNPKMKPYIFGSRNGIHIIDLQKTVNLFDNIYKFISKIVSEGYSVLFIGTKRQAQTSIVEEGERCGMFYVVNRWLGGTLTNFQTIKKSVARLKDLESMKADGSINRYTKKEILKMEKELSKLEKNLGGIKDMDELPGALFIVDPKREHIAIKEGKKSTTDFEYSSKLTEMMLLGNIAIRLKDENTILEWDSEAFKFTNLEKANEYLQYDYAPGWSLDI